MSYDSGSASVYVIGAAALVTTLALPVAGLAVGFAAERDAVRAADLAALGGAQASLREEGLACATAARVALANGGRLRHCALVAGALEVEVTVRTSLALLPEMSAESRAGVRP